MALSRVGSVAAWFHGIAEIALPMAQVLVAAEKLSPAPMAPASIRSFGETNLPPARPRTTRDPAARRTWRSRSQRFLPLTTSPACCCESGHSAGQDVGRSDTGLGQALASLFGADSGLADQYDTAAQAGSQFIGVLGEQRQRDVVGAANVQGLELSGGAYIDHQEVLMLGDPAAKGVRGEGGDGPVGGRGRHGGLSKASVSGYPTEYCRYPGRYPKHPVGYIVGSKTSTPLETHATRLD